MRLFPAFKKSKLARARLSTLWGQKTVPPPVGTAALMRQYQKNPLVYAGVRTIAFTVSKVPYTITVDGDTNKAHPVRKLLARPNPGQMWCDFIIAVQSFLELAGYEFIEKVSGKLDGSHTVELYPIRPDKIEVIASDDGKEFSGIKYMVGAEPPVIAADELIAIKYFNPMDDWMGQSSLMALTEDLVIYQYIIGWVKEFCKKFGAIKGFLSTEQAIGETEAKRLAEVWNRNFRSDKTPLIPKGITWQNIGRPPKESGLIDVIDTTQSNILAALQVPPVKLGLLKHSKYSNYVLQAIAFIEDSIEPRLEKIRSALKRDLFSEWEENIDIIFDTAKLKSDIIEAAKEARVDLAEDIGLEEERSSELDKD